MSRRRMRPPLAVVPPAALVACAVLLSACGISADGPTGGAPSDSVVVATPVTAIPPAEDPVTGLGTVIEKPDSPPELCLGPVRESWPVQCEGIALSGWDWTANPPDAQTDPGSPLTRWGSTPSTAPSTVPP